jgi:hypothetical protein
MFLWLNEYLCSHFFTLFLHTQLGYKRSPAEVFGHVLHWKHSTFQKIESSAIRRSTIWVKRILTYQSNDWKDEQ